MLPEWQKAHLLIRMGSMSLSNSTGAVRSSLMTLISCSFLPRGFSFSWAGAAAARPASRRADRTYRMAVGSGGRRTSRKGAKSQRKSKNTSRHSLFFLCVFATLREVLFLTLLDDVDRDLGLVRGGELAVEQGGGPDDQVGAVAQRGAWRDAQLQLGVVLARPDGDLTGLDAADAVRKHQLHLELAVVLEQPPQ